MRVLSLFDGIGCGRLALRNLQIPISSYRASEIDVRAMYVTENNFEDVEQIGSVTQVANETCDLLIGGSPCQGFSEAGKQMNFEDPRSRLFFDFVRIFQESKPRYFFLENNRMKQEYEDVITEYMGVEPLVVDAGLVSTQHRVRLYWTNIPGACVPSDRKLHLETIVGPYQGIWVFPRGFNKGGIQNYKGKCPTITASNWEHNFKIARNDETLEQFTVRQIEQIQGLPVGYTRGLKESERFKKIGNAWSIPVIEHLFRGLK